uniref:S-protein homolog n=1 Tax=Kalanchoe fedtschenkoi TaxID=63787 RepID=A0A7N0TF11_KALFE
MSSPPQFFALLTLCFFVMFTYAAAVAAPPPPSSLQVRIKNDLGGNMKIKVHCRAGDQSLGTQTIVKGMAIEWKVDPSQVQRSSPYLCDVEWNETEGFHFEAFPEAAGRKEQTCQSFCSWHITEDGPLLQNQKTGAWEAMPYRPLPGGMVGAGRLMGMNESYYQINHLQHKCICYPPRN